MEDQFFIRQEVPSWLKKKVIDFLITYNIFFKQEENTFEIYCKSSKSFNKVNKILKSVQQDSLFETLNKFPQIDVEDLFLLEPRIAFIEIIPYLEDFCNKGLVVDFGNSPSKSSWLIDAVDHVKVIEQEEHISLLEFENRLGVLWASSDSEMARSWLSKIGTNYLSRIYLNKEKDLTDEFDHILDFFNAFIQHKNQILNDSTPAERKSRAINLEREEQSILKSSYSEVLNKANIFFNKQAKKINKIEPINGIKDVFKDERFKAVQLLSEESKDNESFILQHCVGHGGYDLSSGIYSIRTKENKPLATIEVDESGSVVQIQGYKNQIIQDTTLPFIRQFIKDYFKINPEELSLTHNTGWVKITLTFLNLAKKVVNKNIFVETSDNLNSLASRYFTFKIHPLNWREELEKEFSTSNTPEEIKELLLKYLENNAPFILCKNFWGITFNRAIKIPNINRFFLLEELATLIHENLEYFNEPTTIIIREINFKFKSVINNAELINLLMQLDEYFKQIALTNPWFSLDLKKIKEHLDFKPKNTLLFYKKYIFIFKKLYPNMNIKLEPTIWEKNIGPNFEQQVLSQPFLKLTELIKQIAIELSNEQFNSVLELNSLEIFANYLNQVQKAIIKNYITNINNEIKKFNQEIEAAKIETQEFIYFFSNLDLKILESFNNFALTNQKEIADSKDFIILVQKINFIEFHIQKIQTLLSSKRFENAKQAINNAINLINKLSVFIKTTPLDNAKFPDATPMEVLSFAKNTIETNLTLMNSLLKCNELMDELSKNRPEDHVQLILNHWNKLTSI